MSKVSNLLVLAKILWILWITVLIDIVEVKSVETGKHNDKRFTSRHQARTSAF